MSGSQSSRGNPSLGDMMRSVAVLGAILLVLFAVGLVLTSTPDDPVEPVDYKPTVKQVRKTVDYPVLAPPKLPDGWRANSARYTSGKTHAWHLGVLTADDEYLGIEQATVSVDQLVKKFAEDSTAKGETQINGTTWQVREHDDDVIVIREFENVTTLVIGSVSLDELKDYVASLSTGSDESAAG